MTCIGSPSHPASGDFDTLCEVQHSQVGLPIDKFRCNTRTGFLTDTSQESAFLTISKNMSEAVSPAPTTRTRFPLNLWKESLEWNSEECWITPEKCSFKSSLVWRSAQHIRKRHQILLRQPCHERLMFLPATCSSLA